MLSPSSLNKNNHFIEKNFDNWYAKNSKTMHQYELGLACYHYGHNIKSAHEHLSYAAAIEQYPLAYTALGIMYKDSIMGLKHNADNLKIAKILLAKSASEEEPIAVLHLLMMHLHHGEIEIKEHDFLLCEKITGITLKTFRSSISKGEISLKDYSELSKNLIDTTFDDIIFDKSESILKTTHLNNILNKLFTAKKPDANQLFAKAQAYEYGIGVNLLKKKACELYLKARDAGHVLGQIYARKLIDEQKQLANNNNPLAEVKTQPSASPLKNKKRMRVICDDEETVASLPKKQNRPFEIPINSIFDVEDVLVNNNQSILEGVQILSDDLYSQSSSIIDGNANQDEKKESQMTPKSIEISTLLNASAPSNQVELPSSPVPIAVNSIIPNQLMCSAERDFKPSVLAHQVANPHHFFSQERALVKSNQAFIPANLQTVTPDIEPSNQSVSTNAYSSSALMAIGRWGEEFFYYSLLEKYKKEYSDYEFSNDLSGFKCFSKDGKHTIEVIWYNMRNESFKSQDLTVIESHQGVISESLYEVKTTTSKNPHDATISKNEFLEMLLCNKLNKPYYISRVTGAGTVSAKIEIIKNPLEEILNQRLEVTNLTLKI